MNTPRVGIAALFGVAAFSTVAADPPSAKDIKAFMTQAVRSVVDELGPRFEQATGHKLTIIYGVSGAMAARVQDGEPADLLVSTQSAVDNSSPPEKSMMRQPSRAQ